MSAAIENMVFAVLRKFIPPEVMAYATPEKMKEFGEKAELFVRGVNDKLASFEAEQLAQRAMLERLLENAGLSLNADGERGPPLLQQFGGAAIGHSDGGTDDGTGAGSNPG
jgi:hypothetical protein